ncbi:MAG: DUF1080 domain-containing protein [Planctomycetaceae bacterium]|nr:DUF1080 domain-containing protein [Planctomycetaceae bacterium]
MFKMAWICCCVSLAVSSSAIAQERSTELDPKPLLGRWNLTVAGPDGPYPSWIEVRRSGYRTLVGSYVGQFGSARPIAEIKFDGTDFRFEVPPQWEPSRANVIVEGRLDGSGLQGVVTDGKGGALPWTAQRAPSLERTGAPALGERINLLNGQDLGGWHVQHPQVNNGWQMRDGVLVNAEPGNNLVTDAKFSDFELSLEFRYPKGSNSGIYLRGRYEVQIEDNHGQEADSHHIGGVYGHLTPSLNAAKPAAEWQQIKIRLIGRVVSVELNGERIIDRQTIPGVTGGALDSDEGTPGPLMLQGDHGPVEFRNIVLTPINF